MKRKISAFSLSLTLFTLIVATIVSCNKVNTSGMNSNTSTITTVLQTSVNATIFYQAVLRTGLDTIFSSPGPYTVFVPTDSAFIAAGLSSADVAAAPAAAVRDLLLYHTLAGSALITTSFPGGTNYKITAANGDSLFITNSTTGFFVNGIAVQQSDIIVSNGVLQAITAQPLLPAKGNLFELIQTDTNFTLLTAAVTRASTGSTDIQTILSSGGPNTLLAPNNSAFRSYGLSSVDDINNADPNVLGNILLYHIIPSRLFTSSISLGQYGTTMQGGAVYFTATGVQRQIKGTNSDVNADLLKANIMAHNGVLYIIDQVLIP